MIEEEEKKEGKSESYDLDDFHREGQQPQDLDSSSENLKAINLSEEVSIVKNTGSPAKSDLPNP